MSNIKFGHDDERLHETQKSISVCLTDIQGASYLLNVPNKKGIRITVDYDRIDTYPERVNAVAVILRLLDGLGFRFYWATYELDGDDYEFTPAEGGNSIGWMVSHIWGLLNWIHLSITGEQAKRPSSKIDQRDHVLELIRMIQEGITNMSDEQLSEVRIEGLPFWHIINGPISDALSHVGQINMARRLMGKPTPGANVFRGDPPS